MNSGKPKNFGYKVEQYGTTGKSEVAEVQLRDAREYGPLFG